MFVSKYVFISVRVYLFMHACKYICKHACIYVLLHEVTCYAEYILGRWMSRETLLPVLGKVGGMMCVLENVCGYLCPDVKAGKNLRF